MRLPLLLGLVWFALLSGCSGSPYLSASDDWYVVPRSYPPVNTYEAPSGPDPVGELAPGERFQVVGRTRRFYRVRKTDGAETWVYADEHAPPVRYAPERHGQPALLDAVAHEYRTCASFATAAEARAAFDAGNTRLDADGDGQPCEYNSNRAQSGSGRVGSEGVRVRGYTRKDGTYVRPHTRRRPRRN